MIHETDYGTFVISARQQWRPGVFDSARTARIALRRSDKEIRRFQDVAKKRDDLDGVITEELIREIERDTDE